MKLYDDGISVYYKITDTVKDKINNEEKQAKQ